MKKALLWIIAILVMLFAWWHFALPPFNEQVATTGKTQVSEVTIEIKNTAFLPRTLTVKAGQKITVVNRDLMGHSLTADDGSFDSGVLSQDKSALITAPVKPGTYNFHCIVHPTIMTGVLIVK